MTQAYEQAAGRQRPRYAPAADPTEGRRDDRYRRPRRGGGPTWPVAPRRPEPQTDELDSWLGELSAAGADPTADPTEDRRTTRAEDATRAAPPNGRPRGPWDEPTDIDLRASARRTPRRPQARVTEPAVSPATGPARRPDADPRRRTAGAAPATEPGARRPAGRDGDAPDPRVRRADPAAGTGPAQGTDRPPAEGVAGNRLLTILLFLGGLATSVSLWLFDTQPGAINDSATLMIAAGRVTGLVGGYLLFVQLIMMSRVSWLEQWVGARDLLRWHRWLGTSLLVSVLAHIFFLVLGYAKQAGAGVAPQAWTMITTFQDMISATVATGILVTICLLGIRAVRRALPYELWHLIHLSGYLVLLLGYGHQVATGADLSGRFASVFWPGLGALVIAALVWGRVVEPLYLNLRHRFEVADVVRESEDTISIYVTGRDLDRLTAQAGQFMRWRFLTRNGWWQSHPFSLSAAPNPQWLRLTVTAVGGHTASLADLRPGTAVVAEGPFGTFTAEHRTRRKALLIAGGSGIAPIRALLEDMPAETMVIYRARSADDLVFRDELDVLAHRRGAHVRYVVGGRDDPGPRRLLTPDGLRSLVPDVHRRDVYLCGPPGLVAGAVGVLRELEVPTGQLHLDPFEF